MASRILLLCLAFFVFPAAARSAHHRKAIKRLAEEPLSVTVFGHVICDQCLEGGLSKNSAFLPGVNVAIECKNSKGSVEYNVVKTTDQNGTFMAALPAKLVGSKQKSKSCSARVISEPQISCNKAYKAMDESLSLKSSKNRQHIYTAGPLIYQPASPMASCSKKNSEKSTLKTNLEPVIQPSQSLALTDNAINFLTMLASSPLAPALPILFQIAQAALKPSGDQLAMSKAVDQASQPANPAFPWFQIPQSFPLAQFFPFLQGPPPLAPAVESNSVPAIAIKPAPPEPPALQFSPPSTLQSAPPLLQFSPPSIVEVPASSSSSSSSATPFIPSTGISQGSASASSPFDQSHSGISPSSSSPSLSQP